MTGNTDKTIQDYMRDGGTAGLYEVFANILERQRALMLALVDDIERLQGFGQPNGPGPRTARKNQFWREQGKPPLLD